MYDIVISSLTFVLLGVCCLSRERVVTVYGFIIAMYNMISINIPDSAGLLYYLGAAFNDFLIIKFLHNKPRTKIVSILKNTSILFVLINLVGWVVYEAGLEPTGYFILSATTYLYLIFMTTRYGDLRYVGDIGASSRVVRFSGINNKHSSAIQRIKD